MLKKLEIEVRIVELSGKQKEILTKWYNDNAEHIDEFTFECEMDLDEEVFLSICKINYFDTISLAINDFVINTLAKGK